VTKIGYFLVFGGVLLLLKRKIIGFLLIELSYKILSLMTFKVVPNTILIILSWHI